MHNRGASKQVRLHFFEIRHFQLTKRFIQFFSDGILEIQSTLKRYRFDITDHIACDGQALNDPFIRNIVRKSNLAFASNFSLYCIYHISEPMDLLCWESKALTLIVESAIEIVPKFVHTAFGLKFTQYQGDLSIFTSDLLFLFNTFFKFADELRTIWDP